MYVTVSAMQIYFKIIIVLALIADLFILTKAQKAANMTKVCAASVFDADTSAQRACMAAFALQYDWYPSPIAGLYSYQTWNGFDGFWQNGVVLESLANWMAYGNNTMYKSVIKSSIRDVGSLLEAYYPQPSFDDMAWYGLSYARIHEVLGSAQDQPDDFGSSFLDESVKIFDWIWRNGWDTSGSCGGGIWFDQTMGTKQTIENVQMLQLGSKLHRLTAKKLDVLLLWRIERIWKFIEGAGLIDNTTYLVADGVDADCHSNGVFGPTYNAGVMIGGLVEAAKIFRHSRDHLLSLAHKVALATIENSTRSGILVEWCAPDCNDDAKMFKGIFVRNIRYLMDETSRDNQPHSSVYRKFIALNSNTVWSKDSCLNSSCEVWYRDGPSLHPNTVAPVFGEDWRGPYNRSAPMQQTAVLDLLVAALPTTTRCRGDYCDYDPPIPQPHPLTCQPDPCPATQPCCAYGDQYYTCCESTQRCVSGECL